MLQQQQNQHTLNIPSGCYFGIINGKKLHNTTGGHQHNKHSGKRHNGETWDTSNNVAPTKPNKKKLFNISNKHQKISNWIFQKYPNLFTKLGRSKNPHSKKSSTQHNTKADEYHFI